MYSFTCFEAPKFKHLTEQTDTNYVLILVCIHARLTVCSADTTIFYFPHIGSEFIYRERFEQVLSYCVWRRHSSFRCWWKKCKVNFLTSFLLAWYLCKTVNLTVKVHIYCFNYAQELQFREPECHLSKRKSNSLFPVSVTEVSHSCYKNKNCNGSWRRWSHICSVSN